MNNKPRHLLPFKIAGIIGVIAIVTGIVLVVTGFGDFESNRFMIGSFVAVGGVMLTAIGITVGFAPEIAKARAKTVRYIQEENKNDLTAIADNTAEIVSGAVSTVAGAVSDGMKKTMFCKYCGAKIDSDSRFCSVCGKEL